jgi:hypothetical protein
VTTSKEAVMPTYGRQLLLLGPKRNSVLELWEVRHGIDTFGDAHYLSLYGLQPSEWYARGIRLLGQTASSARPTTSPVESVEMWRRSRGSAVPDRW